MVLLALLPALQSICAPQSWIPDAFADNCMSCDKQFGFLTRRHHCRHCGRLICKPCQREMTGMTEWSCPPGEERNDGEDLRASEAVRV